MSVSYRTALITGAAGLIGSAIARLLIERGVRVVACDDFSIGTWRGADEGLVWEEGDVADARFIERLSRHPIDVVVHAAAHPGGKSLAEPSDDVRVNALGSMRLFEWCARTRVPVVYLSSSAVYGEQPPLPIRETATLRPGTVYAVCKVACEQFLQILESGYRSPWMVLRVFATYGAGHQPSTHQGIVNVLLTQLLAGNEVVVRGSLDRVRDLVSVEDAAQAIVTCLLNEQAWGRVINVGTGVPVTIRELLAHLCEHLDRPMERLVVRHAEPTVGDPAYSVAEISQLRQLGVVPQVRLREGVERLVRARRQHVLVSP